MTNAGMFIETRLEAKVKKLKGRIKDLMEINKEQTNIISNKQSTYNKTICMGECSMPMCDNDAQEKFGFLMDAFRYGAPPHGGMAFGFDRIVMLLAGSNQIRDVIAFPKTTSALSLMDNSPSSVSKEQLEELHLAVINDSEE